jgi:hypothetical protein
MHDSGSAGAARDAATQARRSALAARLRDVRRAPVLLRLNGCGFALLGRLADEALAPSYLTMYWLTVFFMPVVPLAVYLIGNPEPAKRFGAARILKRLPLGDFHRLYRGRLGAFYRSVLGDLGRFLLPALLITLALTAIVFAYVWLVRPHGK